MRIFDDWIESGQYRSCTAVQNLYKRCGVLKWSYSFKLVYWNCIGWNQPVQVLTGCIEVPSCMHVSEWRLLKLNSDTNAGSADLRCLSGCVNEYPYPWWVVVTVSPSWNWWAPEHHNTLPLLSGISLPHTILWKVFFWPLSPNPSPSLLCQLNLFPPSLTLSKYPTSNCSFFWFQQLTALGCISKWWPLSSCAQKMVPDEYMKCTHLASPIKENDGDKHSGVLSPMAFKMPQPALYTDFGLVPSLWWILRILDFMAIWAFFGV